MHTQPYFDRPGAGIYRPINQQKPKVWGSRDSLVGTTAKVASSLWRKQHPFGVPGKLHTPSVFTTLPSYVQPPVSVPSLSANYGRGTKVRVPKGAKHLANLLASELAPPKPKRTSRKKQGKPKRK